MISLVTHLGFDGQCAEAMRFYAEVLGAQIDRMMRYDELPPGAGAPMPESHAARILHAHLTLPGGAMLMGADAPPGKHPAPAGFCVSIGVDTKEEAHRIYEALLPGASVVMPIGETFWSAAFGMLTDRYGTPWMVNCSLPA